VGLGPPCREIAIVENGHDVSLPYAVAGLHRDLANFRGDA
jgi:hypothetical protein